MVLRRWVGKSSSNLNSQSVLVCITGFLGNESQQWGDEMVERSSFELFYLVMTLLELPGAQPVNGAPVVSP